MSFFRILPAYMLLAATPLVTAQHGSMNSAISGLYARMDAAFSSKNESLLLSFESPNVVVKNEDGSESDYAGLVKDVHNLMNMASAISAHTTVAEVVPTGDGRIWVFTRTAVRLSVHLPAEASARIGASQVPMISKTAGLDIWEGSGESWHIVRSNILLNDSKVDPAFQQKLTARITAAGAGVHSFSQAMQYAQQISCQTRMIQQMGWQRLGYLTVMPAC